MSAYFLVTPSSPNEAFAEWAMRNRRAAVFINTAKTRYVFSEWMEPGLFPDDCDIVEITEDQLMAYRVEDASDAVLSGGDITPAHALIISWFMTPDPKVKKGLKDIILQQITLESEEGDNFVANNVPDQLNFWIRG
jgi:hypothetical protein